MTRNSPENDKICPDYAPTTSISALRPLRWTKSVAAGGGLRRRKGYLKKSSHASPLISVITVVLNCRAYIEKTILSVLDQNYQNVEYLIIDGGSTDGTLEIIKKYENYIDYWISEQDKGLYDAMNKGIKLASGQIIGIINSDDWYESDALRLVHEEFTKTNADVVCGEMNIYKDNIFYYKTGIANKLNGLKKGMIINHPTVFVKKEVYNNYGAFNLKYKIASDWELMVRYWRAGLKFATINNPIANFRLGGDSYKYNKYTIREKHYIRTLYGLYRFIDVYYLIDKLRLIIPSSLVLKLSVLKQKLFHILRDRFG